MSSDTESIAAGPTIDNVPKSRVAGVAVIVSAAGSGGSTGSSAVPIKLATSMAIVAPRPLLKDSSSAPSSAPAVVGS